MSSTNSVASWKINKQSSSAYLNTPLSNSHPETCKSTTATNRRKVWWNCWNQEMKMNSNCKMKYWRRIIWSRIWRRSWRKARRLYSLLIWKMDKLPKIMRSSSRKSLRVRLKRWKSRWPGCNKKCKKPILKKSLNSPENWKGCKRPYKRQRASEVFTANPKSNFQRWRRN